MVLAAATITTLVLGGKAINQDPPFWRSMEVGISTEHPRAKSVMQNIGEIMSAAAVAILKYTPTPKDFDNNQQLCDHNPSVVCPPLDFQNHGGQWFSTQFVIRRLGLGKLLSGKSGGPPVYDCSSWVRYLFDGAALNDGALSGECSTLYTQRLPR